MTGDYMRRSSLPLVHLMAQSADLRFVAACDPDLAQPDLVYLVLPVDEEFATCPACLAGAIASAMRKPRR